MNETKSVEAMAQLATEPLFDPLLMDKLIGIFCRFVIFPEQQDKFLQRVVVTQCLERQDWQFTSLHAAKITNNWLADRTRRFHAKVKKTADELTLSRLLKLHNKWLL